MSSGGRPAPYVHVPFCARKCHYCAFYSTAADGDVVNRYVGALIRELERLAPALQTPLQSVFFGGGTPPLLNLRQWETILAAFHRLGLAGAAEWTVECNPAAAPWRRRGCSGRGDQPCLDGRPVAQRGASGPIGAGPQPGHGLSFVRRPAGGGLRQPQPGPDVRDSRPDPGDLAGRHWRRRSPWGRSICRVTRSFTRRTRLSTTS